MDLDYAINHVFLPPKLPQLGDYDAATKAARLIDACYNALVSFKSCGAGGQELDAVIKMAHTMKLHTSEYSGVFLSTKTIQEMLPGDIIALNIRAQNAGLIIRRYNTEYRFESFELSPTPKEVISTKGRLRRSFPGPAIVIPASRFEDHALVDEITQFLKQLNTCLVMEAKPHTNRETADPMMVTQMLTGILRGIGSPCEVERFEKRTRDDVLSSRSATPWRRSPDWLLLRVALQSSLFDRPDGNPHLQYKQFMVFFMSQILKQALEASLASESLFIMISKISRRLLKLQISENSNLFWLETVRQVLTAAHDEITKRWDVIEKNQDPEGTQKDLHLDRLSRDSDTALKLHEMDAYVTKVRSRVSNGPKVLQLVPKCQARLDQKVLSPSQVGAILTGSVDHDTMRLSLADVELWVQDYLNAWLVDALNLATSCESLASLVEAYVASALLVYRDSPLDWSIMILTLMELWVALDKCATTQQPLLKQYPSGFPGNEDLFAPLMLPKKQQMERLASTENYIVGRARAITPSYPSVLTGANTPNCFAVRYFDQSISHQKLRQDIEAAAQAARDGKKTEFREKTAQYHQKLEEYRNLQCNNTESTVGVGDDRHPKTEHVKEHCAKCQLLEEAQGMSIDVYEWPLPGKLCVDNDLETKSAIFELSVPSTILSWRDATYLILVDVFSREKPNLAKTRTTLGSFDGLKSYDKGPFGRLQLAATSNPSYQSSYSISLATEDLVCVPHHSHYSILDSTKNYWASDLLGQYDIQKQCTFQICTGPFKSLQYAVEGTTHSSNDILASQALCPSDLTLHEYYAFGTLRAGHLLQWRNIAREIASGALNFRYKETLLLVSQAAWQAGLPSGSIHRQVHVDLQEEEFGLRLITVLLSAVKEVEANWQGSCAVRAYAIIVARLLSLSPNGTTQKHCLEFLVKARDVTCRWTHEVLHLLLDTKNDVKAKEFSERALELALTCYNIFDVDFENCSQLLQSPEDVAIITFCSIVIHDHCPKVTTTLPGHIKMLLDQNRRLAHMVEPILRNSVLSDSNGLDETIREIWASYEPSQSWSALSSPNERWLVTRTLKSRLAPVSEVHFNIIDGSLLVNGSPITRLPHEYEEHATYRRLFAEKVLDVFPSTMSGMVFEAQREFHGLKVHFAKHNDELIIRTQKGSNIHELLPLHCFATDVPERFVSNYAHWLDINSGIVEWRPLEKPWSTSTNNWHSVDVDNNRFLVKGSSQKKLIDIQSPTAKMISRALSPLEKSNHIHIVYDQNTGSLEIHLPRFKLDFFVSKDSTLIESKQFRGMAIDSNQSFGSLTGLVNKLVLCEIGRKSRLVLVPDGEPSFTMDGHHVKVRIEMTTRGHILCHQYGINQKLGLIEDSRGLRSRLFRIHLHALTSHCLPDRLTARTGTEMALFCLRGASTTSFLELEDEHIELLNRIHELTPLRYYYPKNLKLAQTVDWNGLPSLSQHESFATEVESLISEANKLKLFQDGSKNFHRVKPRAPEELLQRAKLRCSSYRLQGFGAEDHSPSDDRHYQSRDMLQENSDREARTFRMAKLVDDMSSNIRPKIKLLEVIKAWRIASGAPIGATPFKLGFNDQYLESYPTSFLPTYWCSLHSVLNSKLKKNKYKLMLFMSTLAFSTYFNSALCQAILALATVPAIRRINVPQHSSYRLCEGYTPDKDTLITIFRQHVRPFEEIHQNKRLKAESGVGYDADARQREFNKQVEDSINTCVDYLIKEWNRDGETPSISTSHNKGECNRYIDLVAANELTRHHFETWRRNLDFRSYIAKIDDALSKLSFCGLGIDKYLFLTSTDQYQPIRAYSTMADLLRNNPPLHSLSLALGSVNSISSITEANVRQESSGKIDTSKLESLLNTLSTHTNGAYETEFIQDLRWSLKTYSEQNISETNHNTENAMNLLGGFLESCQKSLETMSETINDALQPTEQPAERLYMQPGLSPSIILSLLAQDQIQLLTPAWKRAIVQYGIAICNLQRAERLLACFQNKAEFMAEISNPGHVDWDPIETPEWLLLEIENNMLIRKEQVQIAKRMIKPEAGENSVMQLNMGLGKSSVIVPIVAAALADGTKLVRIVVLRPLSKQMFDLLIQKLGGMINRRIFYMPISRSLKLNSHDATLIHNMNEKCAKISGILLVQPEHLLSFELMGLDQSLQGHKDLGNTMIKTQKWLHDNSRDILDESDEVLSVHLEVIYTMGAQRSIDFSPDRWTLIALILEVLTRMAPQVASFIPHGLEILPSTSGSVPRIRILKERAGTELLSKAARELCDTGLPGVPLWKFQPAIRDILFSYITDSAFAESEVAALKDVFDVDSIRMGLLLLRGLFAHGIISFAYSSKRWRVNYGLDLTRSMLAVPYQAKDTPSSRAEFSHPDTTIVLSYLSYYYGGLNEAQMFDSFEKLLRSDTSQQEYEKWIANIDDFPESFVKVVGVNLSNTEQCRNELFPKLRFSKGMVDFYMSHVVFPKELKEFPHKLSASGWDIARHKAHPTTGFSGTNDSRSLLPSSIKQCDLPQLLSTNAAVLDCLLQEENSFDVTHTAGIEVLSASILIEMAIKLEPPARVILDVGAQVLELRNEEVATKWITTVQPSTADAIIFFDDNNDLCVIDRDGLKELLSVSPFLKQMDRCLVFLDEAHTRGTDLKMPNDYRAIVTLGPGLTKDRLVQACMRMRKLGKGQSVVICGPYEVQQKILESNSKSPGEIIDMSDVLIWCIQNTWAETRKSVPLWGTQGIRHYRRLATIASSNNKITDEILEPEAQTLEQRYGFDRQLVDDHVLMQNASDPRLSNFNTQLEVIRQNCRDFGLSSFTDATLQEEQERELQPEQERQQQVERPPRMNPHKHVVHTDVKAFVTTGELKISSPDIPRSKAPFHSAFETLLGTTAAAGFDPKAWPGDLLVTHDFAVTIAEIGAGWLDGKPTKQYMDHFMRPVHWLVSSCITKVPIFVVLSPFEVNSLMPIIRQHNKVRLHVYAPRLSLSHDTLEKLSFCAIPPVPVSWSPSKSVVTQLNTFAGQLYLQNFYEYKAICRFLGLCSEAPDDQTRVGADGFILPSTEDNTENEGSNTFTNSPVALLRRLVAIRCKGEVFSSSHMGKILNGELVRKGDFKRERR